MNFRKAAFLHCLIQLGTAILLCAPASFVQQSPQQTAAAPQQTKPAARIPSYPNTATGLEKLMKNMLKLEKRDDTGALVPYLQSLVLPDPDAWFKSVFGGDLGSRLLSSYLRIESDIPKYIDTELIRFASAKGISAAEVFPTCESPPPPAKFVAVSMRRRPAPLYAVRLGKGHGHSTLGFFAYVDGGFRHVGSLELSSTSPTPSSRSLLGGGPLLRVGGNVQKANLLHWSSPTYPSEARADRLNGTVDLREIFAKDGTVRDVFYFSGPELLAAPAMDVQADQAKWCASRSGHLRRYNIYPKKLGGALAFERPERRLALFAGDFDLSPNRYQL